MIANTRGIVLHSTKYSESSLIVKIYTEAFGMVTYMVNGARSSKGKSKAALFQTANILDLQVYQRKGKNMQHIKEQKMHVIYERIHGSILKTGICMFMVELLNQVIKEQEENNSLFQFILRSFLFLDQQEKEIAIFPIWFMIALSHHLGFESGNTYDEKHTIFDLQEGLFVDSCTHVHNIKMPYSKYWSDISKQSQPQSIIASRAERIVLLQEVETFYALHIESFKKLNSPAILNEVL